MIDDKFIKLPNNLIWDSENTKSTLMHNYGDEIIHILTYLDTSTDRLGVIRFTIEDMILSCGLTPTRGKGRINERFINILKKLIDEKVIEIIRGDINKIKVAEMITCILHMPLREDGFEFFPLFHNHYKKIMNCQEDRILLLKLYCYISARLKRKANKDVGEVAECVYTSYDTICKDLNISESTLIKYLNILKDYEIIYFDNIGTVRKENKTQEANNVYCLKKSEISKALRDSELYYLSEGYTLVGKKTSKEKKVINGLKGKIIQEQNAGKDVTKLEKKMEKLQKSKKAKRVRQNAGIQHGFTNINGQPVEMNEWVKRGYNPFEQTSSLRKEI